MQVQSQVQVQVQAQAQVQAQRRSGKARRPCRPLFLLSPPSSLLCFCRRHSPHPSLRLHCTPPPRSLLRSLRHNPAKEAEAASLLSGYALADLAQSLRARYGAVPQVSENSVCLPAHANARVAHCTSALSAPLQ